MKTKSTSRFGPRGPIRRQIAMEQFEVFWTHHGQTIVQATDKDHAREVFHALDQSETLSLSDQDGDVDLDVTDVIPLNNA